MSSVFGKAPGYGFESWAYVSWSFEKDEREPPQPDPPWLVRLKRERAAMEREDELSRLAMRFSGAMLAMMQSEKRSLLLLCHDIVHASVLGGVWAALAERNREAYERGRMRAADAHSRQVEEHLRREAKARALRERRARLVAEYDRHWARVNHGMPRGLVETHAAVADWYCSACARKQSGRLLGACSACGAERPPLGREQNRQLEARLADANKLLEGGAVSAASFALEAKRTLLHDALVLPADDAPPPDPDDPDTDDADDDDDRPLALLGTEWESGQALARAAAAAAAETARAELAERRALAREHVRARRRRLEAPVLSAAPIVHRATDAARPLRTSSDAHDADERPVTPLGKRRGARADDVAVRHGRLAAPQALARMDEAEREGDARAIVSAMDEWSRAAPVQAAGCAHLGSLATRGLDARVLEAGGAHAAARALAKLPSDADVARAATRSLQSLAMGARARGGGGALATMVERDAAAAHRLAPTVAAAMRRFPADGVVLSAGGALLCLLAREPRAREAMRGGECARAAAARARAGRSATRLLRSESSPWGAGAHSSAASIRAKARLQVAEI